ncbi:hypothetical protein GEV33_002128 [Tenebrio molitor]|uniref:CTP synthase (glutamine hydrolyzing) n=1 Tax=Tenebrio molitor TaxID=7067 RepID=A0A8J6HV05_TENMO|nr:hypothetical protein GEV33_002128 [Tenebrio molitor]
MKPFLGICLGFQTAVIEFARNVLNLKDANSAECSDTVEHAVIIDMPEHNTGDMGGTMRLGKRTTVFKPNIQSKIKRLYGNVEQIEERHRHRYEVNPKYIEEIEKQGLKFVGVDIDAERMEILELPSHPYYVAVQFHPEYLSRPMDPSPPFMGLILAAKDRLNSYFARGCKLSPREPQSDYYDSDDELDHLTLKQATIYSTDETDGKTKKMSKEYKHDGSRPKIFHAQVCRKSPRLNVVV